MSERSRRAAELFSQGLACSQAVLLAFCEDYGLDTSMALRVSCGLGGGCRHGEVCGAVSGGVLVVGLKYGPTEIGGPEAKQECYKHTREFVNAFRARHGHVTCRGLLGVDQTTRAGTFLAREHGLFKEFCPGFVAGSVELLEEMGY